MIGRLRKAHGRSGAAWLAIAVVVAALPCGGRASAHAADVVIPAAREAEIAGLVVPHRLGDEVAAGFRLDGIQIGKRSIAFALESKGEPAERVTLTLTLRSSVGSGFGLAKPYDLSADPPDERQSPSARRAAAALSEVIGRNANDAFWDRVLAAPLSGERRVDAPRAARSPRAAPIAIGVLLIVVAAMAIWSPTATRAFTQVWRRWGAPFFLVATVIALPLVTWLLTHAPAEGPIDPGALMHDRQVLQRDFVRWSLWVALAACGVASIVTLARAVVDRTKSRFASAAAVTLDAIAVLAWSAVVRFVLTEPNILTDGGSGYGRLWRLWIGGWQGLSVLIETLYPEDPRFMWTILRVPWVLAALAPPLLLLLARALGFRRGAALFAGIALASLPLHAAMYSSDFEFGPLLSFDLLGVALAAAAVRFDRAELAMAGAAVLAYTCWGRPDAPIVGAALLAIVAPVLRRWRMQPVLLAAVGWFAVNAVASFAGARALDVGRGNVKPHFWLGSALLRFLWMQEVVPFWLLLPLPFGVAALLRSPRRLVVIGVGIAAGLVPLSVSPVGSSDPTRSYMEYFRYGTWALPWILLVAAEGMDAGVRFVTRRFAGVGTAHARRLELVARTIVIAVCVATPLFYRSYLARQYGPRAEEAAFREVLRRVPEDCGLVVPDDDSDDQGGGTIEIMRRYVFIAEEAAARGDESVDPKRIVGVTTFLRTATEQGAVPPAPETTDRTRPPCWYYFRGSYCYTGLIGQGSPVCGELERHAALEPILTQRILYISHRLVTRPDLTDPPLYDPDQSLVLSKVVGWRTDVAGAAASR